MTLARDDFDTYFAAMHDAHTPYPWQGDLLDMVLAKGQWPERINAPTAAGKTAVIDVHVFALALMATTGSPVAPRRLALVVDRRVLVDDQFDYASELARKLREADDDSVLGAIRERLWALRTCESQGAEPATTDVSPLVVARLRGGSPPSRAWRDHPTAAAVICATPDMWGSRLLFRGYGSSRLAWPREAGLLAVDSVVVVDEAHLAWQLLCTARRVAELVDVAERKVGAVPLQVVETTATPATDHTEDVIGLSDADRKHEVLSRILDRPKPITLLPSKEHVGAKPTATSSARIADAVLDMLEDTRGNAVENAAHTVGCFVNTVGRAVSVTHALHSRRIDGRAVRVVMICGQARPIDIARLNDEHPGLLDARGNDGVDVVVTTQSLEVGVNVDFAGIVSELASASALVQRAGRVNRRGLRAQGPITILMPDLKATPDNARSGPYEVAELLAAATWLRQKAATPNGLAAGSIHDPPPPTTGQRRELLQRPELGDAWHWARTSDTLSAEPELELWLTDDFERDTSVGLVVRDALPEDGTDAKQLIAHLPPRRHEVFSVPFGEARSALMRLPQKDTLTAIRVRGDDIAPLEWRSTGDRQTYVQPKIRPGDIIVLDSATDLFTKRGKTFSPPVLVPADSGATPERADDVLEAQADLSDWKQRSSVGRVVHRIELRSADSDRSLSALRRALIADDEPLTLDQQREAVRVWLSRQPNLSRMARAASELLSQTKPLIEVITDRDADDEPLRVLLIDRRSPSTDDVTGQVWTSTDNDLTLDDHQGNVGDRAATFAGALGLDAACVDAIALAGEHHDDGKRDRRFQRRLGARGNVLIAKSPPGITPEQARRNEDRSGLPSHWRHEQRSVVDGWDAIRSTPDWELVARLVGTSHGYGRNGFPHTAAELLLDANAVAAELFDLGGWDDLIERTQQRYGVWTCAYLEAVLRAADAQVSREGR